MRGKAVSIPVLLGMFVLAAVSACSRNTGTYDELDNRNAVEEMVRKEYGSFFKAIQELGEAGAKGDPDSAVIRRAALRTDRVVADVRAFPQTVESRLAVDALSYAARDLTRSPGFSRIAVSDFWEQALLQPIIFIGNGLARSHDSSPTTRRQIVKALGRGIGDKSTTDIYLQILPIFGATPDSTLMRIADSDSLVFRHIRDLILYGRSLQPVPPPRWMLTGSWFLALDISGFFPGFVGIVPVVDGRETYVTARFYEPGEVYERVFHDPAPSGGAEGEAWIARASAFTKALSFHDSSLVANVRMSGLETFDAHYFFDDYLVHTGVDSVKKEFMITLKRPKIVQDGLRSLGEDSISIIFSLSQIMKPDGAVTVLVAVRQQGETVIEDRRIPAKSGTGRAFLMPLGEHSDAVLRMLAQQSLPKISVVGK